MSLPRKILLEEADRPPPSYYGKSESPDNLRKLPFQTPDPEKWLQAPEFVPRSRKLLNDAFAQQETPPPYDPNLNPIEDYSTHHFPEDGICGAYNGSSVTTMEAPFVSNIDRMQHSITHGPAPPFYPSPYPVGNLSRQSLPPVLPPPLPFAMVPPFHHQPHGMPNIHSNPMGFVPSGYSANITNLNGGIGPPIPAIVLKKKRRRRNKNQTQSMLIESEKDSASPPAPSDPTGFGRESTSQGIEEMDEETPDDEMPRQKVIGGSCPDLTEDQLTMWDNYLYDSIVDDNSRNPPPPAPRQTLRKSEEKRVVDMMQTSAYEIVPRAILDVAEQALDGFSNREIRKLDREINGNSMTASMVLTSLKDRYAQGIDTDGSTEKSLATEMGELSFRPEISKYGYPQYDADRGQMATFHPDVGVKSTVVAIRDKNGGYVEDCFEGMNIRVNNFEDCDDLALSESECPEPTRFQKIQWALKNGTTAPLQPPDRVCCSIM